MDDAIARLADAGFDLAHTFDARAAARLAGWEALADAPTLGILIGNTRALWPRFVAAMPELAAEAHPLERYTEQTVERVFAGATVFYGHRRYEDRFLPFQALAVATGLGALAPSQLVIHPVYGPWFALRAVVAIDGTPPERSPITQPCRCDAGCRDALATALATTPTSWRAWLAVRDHCALRAWRYTDEQIAYHYTHAFPARSP